jgi:hypothetical protein
MVDQARKAAQAAATNLEQFGPNPSQDQVLSATERLDATMSDILGQDEYRKLPPEEQQAVVNALRGTLNDVQAKTPRDQRFIRETIAAHLGPEATVEAPEVGVEGTRLGARRMDPASASERASGTADYWDVLGLRGLPIDGGSSSASRGTTTRESGTTPPTTGSSASPSSSPTPSRGGASPGSSTGGGGALDTVFGEALRGIDAQIADERKALERGTLELGGFYDPLPGSAAAAQRQRRAPSERKPREGGGSAVDFFLGEKTEQPEVAVAPTREERRKRRKERKGEEVTFQPPASEGSQLGRDEDEEEKRKRRKGKDDGLVFSDPISYYGNV